MKNWLVLSLLSMFTVSCSSGEVESGAQDNLQPPPGDFVGDGRDNSENTRPGYPPTEQGRRSSESPVGTTPEERTDPEPTPVPPNVVVGNGCFGVETKDLVSCCGGTAHCVPTSFLPSAFEEKMTVCPEGGLCVADNMIEATNVYLPINCSSFGGAPGACVSQCVPDVQDFLDILPTEGCSAGYICAPCIDPLSGTDTGACSELECPATIEETETGVGEGEEGGKDETLEAEEETPLYSCENPPIGPIIDLTGFGPCYQGAHCVPTALVPAEFHNMLSDCDAGAGLCVPDELVAYGGFYTPPTCLLPGNVEGRCLSLALPDVAAQANLAPQLNCQPHELCIPCCDPFTAEDTGACDIGCDTGPTDGICEVVYTTCCDGVGSCVPEELVPPDDAESLSGDDCADGLLCAPDSLQDPNFQPVPCEGEILFTAAYVGVCLPKCLDIPFDDLIWSGTCSSSEDCVPCTDPLTGEPTGAPGCLGGNPQP